MKLLLDTHSFLWFINGDKHLSPNAYSMMTETTNKRFLSVASLWEIDIKISLGKLTIAEPLETFFHHQLTINGIALLGITLHHAIAVRHLPFHHRDPFDRLLVAQSMLEHMPIVSKDATLDAYSVTRLW